MSRDSRFQGGSGLTPHHLASQAGHASAGPMMGDVRGDLLNNPDYAQYNQIPADYVIQILLGGAAGSRVPEQTEPLRPEPWLLHTITYATTADILTAEQLIAGGGAILSPPYSEQARSVELEWGDEFTRFMGNQPALVASIFADSYGFLDLSEPILFQGSQQLSITLHRLFWPFVSSQLDIPEVNTNWDFVFHGVSLLPKGVNESGAV